MRLGVGADRGEEADALVSGEVLSAVLVDELAGGVRSGYWLMAALRRARRSSSRTMPMRRSSSSRGLRAVVSSGSASIAAATCVSSSVEPSSQASQPARRSSARWCTSSAVRRRMRSPSASMGSCCRAWIQISVGTGAGLWAELPRNVTAFLGK